MSIQTENVFNCLKAVIRWSDLRWDSKKVLDIVKENGVFVLTRSDIELLKQFIPDLKNVRIRGYLGVMPQDDKKLPQFQLMLLSEDHDIDISLDPGRHYEEPLVMGTYTILPGEEIEQILASMAGDEHRAALADRIKTWRRTFDVYIQLMTKHEKSGDAGLVRLFDIPGKDLAEEIGDGCERVLCFFGLLKDTAVIDMIFQGVDPAGRAIIRPRQQGAAVPAADDFTTPRPPFGGDEGYGLL